MENDPALEGLFTRYDISCIMSKLLFSSTARSAKSYCSPPPSSSFPFYLGYSFLEVHILTTHQKAFILGTKDNPLGLAFIP